MPLAFVDPHTHEPLERRGDSLVAAGTGRRVAPVVDSIPRFVEPDQNYAESSFGFQWKHWRDVLSDARSTGTTRRELVLRRTHFAEYDLVGKTLLECGMGGGDDTEVLLQMPFAEVHSFDLSTAVERARDTLDDPRLTLSQASILEIPYADHSFDFVYCHRVLQHCPDPVQALRCIARKVKPGGVLFAHVYKRSWRYSMGYKYKYRWLTTRVPPRLVFAFVERFGESLFTLHCRAARMRLTRKLAHDFVPFEPILELGSLDRRALVEVGKLVTFDALTPAFDRPMRSAVFRRTIEEEGFRIDCLWDPPTSPLYATATRIRPAAPAALPVLASNTV